jgi:hypothetical protein
MSVCLSICLAGWLSICLSGWLAVDMSGWLAVCLSVRISSVPTALIFVKIYTGGFY